MTTVWKIAAVFVAICIFTAAGQCSDNCLSDPANATAPTCSETTGECGFGCAQGFAGLLCNYTCVLNCQNCTLDSTADPPSPVCELCDDDFYLKSDRTCGECSTRCATNDTSDIRTCADETAQCNLGCRDGFHGTICNRACTASCNAYKCDQMTAVCDGCGQRIRCGPSCSAECNTGCSMEECNQDCVCDGGCKPDFYGERCSDMCSDACMSCNNTERSCTNTTGDCICGCTDVSTHGPHCDKTCPVTCVDSECHQLTGNCAKACPEGFSGDFCDQCSAGNGAATRNHGFGHALLYVLMMLLFTHLLGK